MIDFSDKTQLTSFVAVVAAILCLLAVVIVFWTRMRKRLSGGAFAAWLTATIIILTAGIAACLTTIAYKTEFLKIDSEVVGNALAFEYDGNIVFSIPGLGVFFDVVFNYALVEMLLYVVTLVDLALLVLVCIRRGVTRALYSGNCDGEGYYTVSEHEDEPGAFAVCDEPSETETEPAEEETEPVAAVSEESVAIDEPAIGEAPVFEPLEEENASADENDEETVSPANDMPAPLEEYVEDEEPVAEENEQPVEEEAVWVEKENQPTEFVEEAVPEEKEEIEEPVETTESAPIADEEPTTEDEIAKAESEPTTEEEPAIGAEETRSEEPATEIETPVESANVTEPEKAGTETPESAKPAQPEEKTPDRTARFMAPVVAADKERRTSETATVARKNGRVTVKSRAAEMFDEYLGGRSAADREKLLDSIDVITKKND